MSSDSSDSEGGREDTHRRSTSESNSANAHSPPPVDKSNGPKTPGSPISNKSFESLSPEGPRSPSSPAQSRSRSRSLSRSNVRSRSNSHSAPRSHTNSPSRPKSPSVSPSRARSRSNSADSKSPSRSRSLASRSRSTSPAPKRGPRSPPDNFDDDGRSNISSGSSILSRSSPKPMVNGEKASPCKVPFSVPNAEDLSDVSDIGEVEDDLGSPKDSRDSRRERDRRDRGSDRVDDDGELDFEVEEQPDADKEDGECDREKPPPQVEKKTEAVEKPADEDGEDKSGDEGECKEDEVESLEEGEVSDDGDPKPEKPPICRFYSRGACTWGNNCRFLHPGVTDKGNYSMFETSRPIVAGNGLGLYPPEPRPYPVILAPARTHPTPYGPVAVRREDPAAVESAWERGLRQAKELMRISTKRKESDMDFEDKKMNMSIGQDEMDKENDYYTRVGSPAEPDPWPSSRLSPRREEGEVRRPVRVVERYEDILPEPIPPPYERFDHRRVKDPDYMLRRDKFFPDEEGRRSKKMVREVIMQRGERAGKRGLSPDGRKPDEWRDPWMRTRSPATKQRARKTSYSSGSSSYSGSSSRSSSNSSYSSYSRSRSRSRSGSRSPAGRRRGRSPPPGIPIRPKGPEGKFKPMKTVAVAPPVEKVAERPLLMNPPAPSPLRIKRPVTPNTAMRKVGLNPPAPTPKKTQTKRANKVRGKKSRSSSSGSSGSSSDSSHSSYSSSSSGSSGNKSPPARASKKGDAEERLKSKELRAAAKASQKADKVPPTATIAGKKRPAEDASPPKEDSPGKTAGSKKGSSRREELLKQLKAVEDAIARKRSKI